MTKALSSVMRPLGPRDHLRYPQLERISAALESLTAGPAPSLNELLEALGDQAEQVTLSSQQGDGGFFYAHFGSKLVEDAGFDMTGKSTSDFETSTRQHIEMSFHACLEHGAPVTTIMPGSPGSTVSNWQRVVYPVELDCGPHILSLVKPLRSGAETIHARPSGVCIGVLPLSAKDNEPGFVLTTTAPLDAYLLGADTAPIESFVDTLMLPDEQPEPGTLLAACTFELDTQDGAHLSLVVDVVFGFSAPYLVVANVTGSATTQENLESTSHLLQASFELGRLGSWTNTDCENKRFYLGPELADMFGLSLGPDGLVEMEQARNLYEPQLREASIRSVAQCWETGQSYVNEGLVTRPDGKQLYVRISGSAMRDQAGRIISLFGLVQDITDVYQTRRALEESEERFRDFASTAGDWCWETDAEHKFVLFTEVNDDGSRNLQKQYTGKTRRDMPVLDEDRPIIDAHFEDLHAHRPFTDLVYRVRDSSGEVRSIQVAGQPKFARNGTFIGYRGTARNITESVVAAEEKLENQLAIESAQAIAKLGHWITDLTTGRTRWSQGLMALVGAPDMQAGGEVSTDSEKPWWYSMLARVHVNDRRTMVRALRAGATGQRIDPFDIRYFPQSQREPQHLRIMLRLKESSTAQGAQLLGVAQDVSALKRTQGELEQRSATLIEAQEMGGIGDWQYDLASGTVSWSRNLYTILGVVPEHFTPSVKAIFALCSTEDAQLINTEQTAVLNGKPVSSIDVQARRGDGTFGYYTMMTKPKFDDRGAICGLFGTVQDITERKHAEKQLRSLAFFDPLTGLANRALFSRELTDVLNTVRLKGGSAALFLLDLDHFKEVNDSLGHAAGDELLRRVARTLKETLNEKGFVARLGGDEFAVVVRNYASVTCLEAFANKIVERLTGVLRLDRGEVMIGTSLGIALIPQDGGTAEEALRNADMALYMAKDEGRGRCLFFTPIMSRSVQARLNMARDLRFAIENDHLETRFQGQVGLTSGKVEGFETLVRWKHPEKGYISPAEFIPVAESSALICEIGLWVLRDACRKGRAWLDAGEPERMISVNVSAAQIWQSDFEDDMLNIVAETGYPPHLLCLELTESVFADHGEGRVRKALSRFKEAGIHLAVDDFGTGYSSLGYLNDLPFDELKIDRCFVAGAHLAPEKARLLKGIIALGRGLGMNVVAEGAEEDGELALLRAYGCDMVQGFVYMRPEKAADALRKADELEFRLAAPRTTLQSIPENTLKKTG